MNTTLGNPKDFTALLCLAKIATVSVHRFLYCNVTVFLFVEMLQSSVYERAKNLTCVNTLRCI